MSRAMEVELTRMGYVDTAATNVAVETTQAAPLPEQAVPEKPKGRGRPPRPRCEHGMIVDRCDECKKEGV